MSGPSPDRLTTSGLCGGHRGVVAFADIDLHVAAGEILAVIGPNGAGKTTLLHTLAGLLASTKGQTRVDGHELRRGSPRVAHRAGVVLVPDDRGLFRRLSVAENLRLATRRNRSGLDRSLEIFPALRPRLKLAAGQLSGGEQQMLALARGLALQPKVLMIDEMSMGLAPMIVEDQLQMVRRVADESSCAVVLVEQHVHLALRTADRAVVMANGRLVLQGPATELLADEQALHAAYLGGAPGAENTHEQAEDKRSSAEKEDA